ncbi:MAG: hypothetical protein GTO08_02940 [Deltaproteobacteria bacterium]|nr:hypothetical protein [Deltaproteobacteria bacterium]
MKCRMSYPWPGNVRELEDIIGVLEKNRWNRGAAAGNPGVDRTTLWKKMIKYGLP